jgi:hypothetical protein
MEVWSGGVIRSKLKTHISLSLRETNSKRTVSEAGKIANHTDCGEMVGNLLIFQSRL